MKEPQIQTLGLQPVSAWGATLLSLTKGPSGEGQSPRNETKEALGSGTAALPGALCVTLQQRWWQSRSFHSSTGHKDACLCLGPDASKARMKACRARSSLSAPNPTQKGVAGETGIEEESSR